MEEPSWLRTELVSVRDYAELTVPKGHRGSDTSGRSPVDKRIGALQMARLRRDDFPSPRGGTPTQPLYLLGELLDFSERRERAGRIASLSGGWVLLRAIDRATAALADAGMVDRLIRHALGCLGQRLEHRAPKGALDRLLDGDLPDPVRGTLEEGVGYAVAEVGGAMALVESVVERYRLVRGGQPTSTESGLDDLLVAVAAPSAGATVYDPAAGEGDVLLAAAAGTGLHLVGQEQDPDAWAVVAVRAAARGVDLHMGEGPVDSFEHDPPGSPFDAVLLDPPLPSDTTAWMRLALRNTGPGGRAVVVLPAGERERQSKNDGGERPPKESDLAEQWEQLTSAERSAVRAIVLTPDRLRRDDRGNLAVWVLEPGTEGDLRVIDARLAAAWSGSRKGLSSVTSIAAAVHDAAPEDPEIRWADLDAGEIAGKLQAGMTALFPVEEAVSAKAEEAAELARKLQKLIAAESVLDPFVTEEHRRGLKRLLRAMDDVAPRK